MSRIRWYGPTLLLLFTLVLAMVLGPSMVQRIARSYQSAHIAQVRKDLIEDPTLTTLSEAFKDVATVVRPSVTSISLQAQNHLSSSPNNGRMVNLSNGSGWVYRHYAKDGSGEFEDYVVTNNHVVEDLVRGRADRAIVRFDDGGEYEATVVGTDSKADVAVLHIDRPGLIPMAIATEPAQQGEIVFAVGSPFQFEFSMSQGIVSATGRRLRDNMFNTSYENFIQTDAAINPGNSGGPLANVRGEVIGMNTAIAVEGNPAATFSGLGFAIPIDQAVDVVDKLIEFGEVRRGYIGVYIYDLDFKTAQAMEFTGKGVVCEPVPGGPADQAGVLLGDIITHVDGKAVATAEELRIQVSIHTPGSTVPIRVWRRGRAKTLQMTLAESPVQARVRTPIRDPFARDSDRAVMQGIAEFTDYTPAIAQRLGRPYQPGVLAVQIASAQTTLQTGLSPTDVVTRIDNREVYDKASFIQALDDADDGPVTLTVLQWKTGGTGGYVEREIEIDRP